MAPFFTRHLRVAGWPSIPQGAFFKIWFCDFWPKVATSAVAKRVQSTRCLTTNTQYPDLLAQLADRWTYYPEVQGSIPERGLFWGVDEVMEAVDQSRVVPWTDSILAWL